MLSKQRCPHTGIVNYFTKADPFVSIGSITTTDGREPAYHWRCYDAALTIAGIAKDMSDAEVRLQRAYRRRTASEPNGSVRTGSVRTGPAAC